MEKRQGQSYPLFKDTLTNFLIEAVEAWQASHPDTTVGEVRGSLHSLIDSFEQIANPPTTPKVVGIFDRRTIHPAGQVSVEAVRAATDILRMAESGEVKYIAAALMHSDESNSTQVGGSDYDRGFIGVMNILLARHVNAHVDLHDEPEPGSPPGS